VCVSGVLDHDGAAVPLDEARARGAVVEQAGHDDAYTASANRARRAPEERVDGGPVPVLAWAARQADVAILDEHVIVGGRHEDLAALQFVAVLRECSVKRPAPGEDLGQHAGSRRRDV
jgi:hypothetical protein